MNAYDPNAIESKWQARWEAEHTFRATEDSRPKYYALCMFPYPSGSGLHVGHPESYTAIDIVARYKRMRGFSVLNPIGFDAFGLPAERAAVQTGKHPAEITNRNIDYFRRQLKRLGFSFDWSREVSTCEPDYYRWTQWIFLRLYERGLAYLADVPVWWCPAQGTVLANEEVVDGRYVETGEAVERRNMKQWMLKITAYAERLLKDLDGLDWPEGVLEMQRQWIGRSEGAEIVFPIADQQGRTLTVFTTRPDTLFGVTFCVVAPEHPLLADIITNEQRAKVESYIRSAVGKSELERSNLAKIRTGVFTGAYVVNPLLSAELPGARIPIWVADYVLASYGTGAIMAVPGHDQRDFEFAKQFGLPMLEVVRPPEGQAGLADGICFTGEGRMVNSPPIDDLASADARKKVIALLEERGAGKGVVRYKLRDWLFSRQRYWGEPFPIIYDETGTPQPLSDGDLPISLPYVDEFRPTADGRPPLARAEDWLCTTFNGSPATRETNTMPQWAGSCWYYLRYMDPHNTTMPFSPEREKYWGPVDLYIGGVEHAVLHLLYARFWHKVLFDCGLVHTTEPFQKLFNQGMILAYSYRELGGKYHHPDTVEERPNQPVAITSAWNGDTVITTWYVSATSTPVERKLGKMGKSLNNSVDPLDVIDRYGADTLRLYEMFMGPLDQVKPWQTAGCEGISRFLARVWRLYVNEDTGRLNDFGATSKEVARALNLCVKVTTDGIESLRFNTPISRMMEFVNACGGKLPDRAEAEAFVLVLSPYAPHIAEELWARLGYNESLANQPWPTWNNAVLTVDEVTIAVQVDGKMRGTFVAPKDSANDELVARALEVESVRRAVSNRPVARHVVVPNRLVNLILGGQAEMRR